MNEVEWNYLNVHSKFWTLNILNGKSEIKTRLKTS